MKNINSGHMPTHFHIGLLKTGSTTVQKVLQIDPRVNVAVHRRYFNTNKFYEEQPEIFGDGDVFVESDENICIDSGAFAGLELTLERICSVIPNPQIIFVLREQKSLLISAFKHHVITSGDRVKSFRGFIDSWRGQAYLRVLKYDLLYKRIKQYIPDENIHFMLFEDLLDDYEAFFAHFYKLLGLERPKELPLLTENKGPTPAYVMNLLKLDSKQFFSRTNKLGRIELKIKRKMSKYMAIKKNYNVVWEDSVLFSKLNDEFKDSNEKFIRLTGMDLSKWT